MLFSYEFPVAIHILSEEINEKDAVGKMKNVPEFTNMSSQDKFVSISATIKNQIDFPFFVGFLVEYNGTFEFLQQCN